MWLRCFFNLTLCLLTACCLTGRVVGKSNENLAIPSQYYSQQIIPYINSRFRTIPVSDPLSIEANSHLASLDQLNSIKHELLLLESDEPLFFTLPPRQIYMSKNYYNALSNNEKLAIIAHNIGHLDLEHSANLFFDACSYNSLTKAEKLDNEQINQLALRYIDSEYSLEQEIEADTYSLALLSKSNIPLNTAIAVINKYPSSHVISTFSSELILNKRKSELEKQITTLNDLLGNQSQTSLNPNVSNPRVEQANSSDSKHPIIDARNLKIDETVLKKGWYITSSYYQDSFDAELAALEIMVNSIPIQVIPAKQKELEVYFIALGPFYKKEYAKENRQQLIKQNFIQSDYKISKLGKI